MMLSAMFMLVYLLLPHKMLKLYIFFYLLFIVYFAGNFISFIGSHKVVLDAFGHDTISKISKKKKIIEVPEITGEENQLLEEKEFKTLAKRLDKWVNEKKYKDLNKSREETAAELGVSKELLYTYFKLKIGIDFRTWRTQLRIEEAKGLLLDSNRTSTNLIGEMVGFSDRSNFHRQFKKIVGISPKEWRESKGKI